MAHPGVPSQAFRGATQVSVLDIARVTGVKIASLGRDILPYTDLAPEEIENVVRVFNAGVEHLRKISPKLATDIARQVRLAIEFAAVAKATFPIRGKNYTFPSVPGHLGVAWLFPQAIKYSATVPTGYANNSWDIPISTDRAYWILGDGTNYYKCNPAEDSRSFMLIFQNGLVEVGSTPAAEQFQVKSESRPDLGMYTVEPLVEVHTEDFKPLYQYPTPGALFVDHIKGVMWGFRPKRAGVATMKLLGLVYYEFNFVGPGFKWI